MAQIRPSQLKASQEKVKGDDRLWLRLEMLRRSVRIVCPACSGGAQGKFESAKFQLKWGKDGFCYWECISCGTVYMSPRPSEDLLEEYHRRSAHYRFWAEHIFPASEEVRFTEIALPRAKRIAQLCREHDVFLSRTLDIGAGYGTFCRAMRSAFVNEPIWDWLHGYDIDLHYGFHALEPVPSLAAACRKSGFTVHEQTVAQQKFPEGYFDVITAWEVIEHIFSPRDFLEKCYSWLGAGRLLCLSCPNVMGFDVFTLGAKSGVIEHEHLTYFHPVSIAMLLEEVGFSVLEITTPGRLDAELVHQAALAGWIDLHDQPFLNRVLVTDWDQLGDSFQAWLAEAGLSSHMQVICRKQG